MARAGKKTPEIALPGVTGVTLSNPAPSSEAAVQALAAELGAALPDDYAAFLVTCGGGYLRPPCSFPTGKKHASVLQLLVGLCEKPPQLALAWRRRTFASRVPDDLLVIGSDVFGNQLCLRLRGRDRGKVFFWDHENETPDEVFDRTGEPWRENLTRVAPSFTAFLRSLTPVPDEDDPD